MSNQVNITNSMTVANVTVDTSNTTQVTVNNSGVIDVTVTPNPAIEVTLSRAAISTVANVANANYANFAGQVVDSTQANITSVGALTGLTTTGNIDMPTSVLADGILLPVPGNYVAVTDSTQAKGLFVDDTGISLLGNVADITVVGNVTSGFFIGDGNGISNVQVANITGLGNIATVNLTGSSSNVLYGNGVFAPAGSSNVANANYANFAGTAFSVSASNISGTINLANFATTANSVAGANVSGAVGLATYATTANSVAGANVSGQVSYAAVANSVAVANVSGIGNIATVNLNGNGSQVLAGNGSWVNNETANANYANFAGTAFSVSGSNVSGAVNLATYATTANSVAGANVTGQVSYSAVANSVAGANVSGTVANATYATNSGTASVANSVAVANVSGIGNIATVNLNGNASQVLAGNGAWVNNETANANYANFAGTAFSVSGSNVSGAVNLATYATTANSVAGANVSGQVSYAAVANSVAGANVSGTVANATYATSAGSANTANSATVAATANSVAGANVTGQVSFAATANSVAVANVSGIGNIATVNLDGNISNVLSGTGTWVQLNTGSVANANYANFAGTAFSVSGSNVSGEVANAAYSNISGVSYSVSGSNVSGAVANATYATSAGSATVANSANSVAGANVSGQVANALIAGTVYTNAQPNITSVGTLTSLNVTGNVSANAYQLTTSPGTITVATGQMAWSAAEQTMNLGMNNGVTQQVGLESYILVKASAAITNGQVVMFTGASGDNVLAAPANAASAGFKAEYIIGVATQDIANNGTGYITVFGQVHGLNTNSYNVGDELWYDPTSTTGGFTNVQPTDPQFQIQVAAVTKKSGGDGHIQVRVSAHTSLTNLTDAQITTPTTGQALVYNGSNVWINGIPNIANIAYSVSGSNVSGAVNLATYATTANSVAGANVSGTVANATYATSAGSATTATSATTAGTVTTNAQPNITSTGTLTGLTVSGTADINLVSITSASGDEGGELNLAKAITNTTLSGNIAIDVYQNKLRFFENGGTNRGAYIDLSAASAGVGSNLLAGGGGGTPGGSNTYVQFNDAGTFGGVANLTFNKTTNTLSATNIVGNGSGLTSLTGANVTGAVAYATTANSVAGSNVSGQVSFAAVANSVAGSNVSGAVGLATYATTANAVAGANVSGQVSFAAIANSVAVANVSGIGNIAVLNLNGSSTNVLYGNGTFADISVTSVANANYSNFAGTAYSVSGANVSGAVSFATTANSVAGANVSGQVSFAAVANSVAGANVSGAVSFATTANSVAVANVSGIGNIATTNYNGNAQTVLVGNGTWTGPSIAQFSRSAGQTTGLTAGNAIVFNTTTYTIGSGISLNTSTGIITLDANRTYKLTGILNRIDGSTNAGYCDFQWRNTTSNTLIGILTSTIVVSNGSNAAVPGIAYAVITPSVSTTVKLEIQGSSALTQIGQFSQLPVAIVEVIK